VENNMETGTDLRGSGISKRTIAILIAVVSAVAFLASSCGQSTSSAKLPTAANPSTPAVVATAPPVVYAPPGGPVPAQLLGAWFLSTASVDATIGCQAPLSAANCRLSLNLTATKYSFAGTLPSGPGEVVVNNTEIDFFNASQCDSQGPAGLGRYTWTLASGVLHLAPLNSDPCGRSTYLTNQSFYRKL
jgi:hypothetical protein